jgi:hypothetical protein
VNPERRLFEPKENGPKVARAFDFLDSALWRSGHVAVSASELARKLAALDHWPALVTALRLDEAATRAMRALVERERVIRATEAGIEHQSGRSRSASSRG